MIQKIIGKNIQKFLIYFFGIHVRIVSFEGISVNAPRNIYDTDLAIPDKANIDIYDCIKTHYLVNHLPEKAWFNEETNKKEDVKRRFLVWSFPKILIITLKRFYNPEKKTNLCTISYGKFNLTHMLADIIKIVINMIYLQFVIIVV